MSQYSYRCGYGILKPIRQAQGVSEIESQVQDGTKNMKRIFNITLILLAFAGIVTSQYFFDTQKKKVKFQEPFILKPKIVKAANLGLNNASADLAWLGAIQYFGGGESKSYRELPSYLSLASELDPKFSYPYAFGVLILPGLGYMDQGVDLALKGIKDSLPDWRIPYYLATIYHLDKNDPANAAKYFDIAANTKGAPDGIKKVAANYGSKGNKRERTKQIWTGIYETTNDSVVKERAKNYLIHFEIMDLLEQASAQYHKINNKYPANVNDLVSARILKAIPEDPFGFQFEVNQTDGTVNAK